MGTRTGNQVLSRKRARSSSRGGGRLAADPRRRLPTAAAPSQVSEAGLRTVPIPVPAGLFFFIACYTLAGVPA